MNMNILGWSKRVCAYLLKKRKVVSITILVVIFGLACVIVKRHFGTAVVTTLQVDKVPVFITHSAIVSQGYEDRKFVWIFDNGLAKLEKIELGEQSGNGRERVIKGLKKGDNIILYSSKALRPGMSVKERLLQPGLFGKDGHDYVGKRDYVGASGEEDIHIQIMLGKDIAVTGYKIITEDNQAWAFPYNGNDWIIYPVRKGNVVDLFFEPKTPFIYNLYAVLVQYVDKTTQFELVK